MFQIDVYNLDLLFWDLRNEWMSKWLRLSIIFSLLTGNMVTRWNTLQLRLTLGSLQSDTLPAVLRECLFISLRGTQERYI